MTESLLTYTVVPKFSDLSFPKEKLKAMADFVSFYQSFIPRSGANWEAIPIPTKKEHVRLSEGRKFLIDCIRNQKEAYSLTLRAIELVGQLKIVGSTDALEQRFSQDKNPKLRLAIVASFMQLENPSVIPFLSIAYNLDLSDNPEDEKKLKSAIKTAIDKLKLVVVPRRSDLQSELERKKYVKFLTAKADKLYGSMAKEKFKQRFASYIPAVEKFTGDEKYAALIDSETNSADPFDIPKIDRISSF
ncbi:hypothetical protein HZC07_01710 [Candidatus Micrarchaeota archaeon]|nr:hypothetical protein [Candidatus Micrarchaeota archaeon]